mmetsp:Transcript_6225/g.9472  ORF Transcript_6225/g.9472 Transcript_6225/m.9472 type:complete len:202 (-) Transcript_6225:132-737(-)
MAARIGAIPDPAANINIFWAGKSYLSPFKFSSIGNPLPNTWLMSTDTTGLPSNTSRSVNHPLLSVFFTRNSNKHDSSSSFFSSPSVVASISGGGLEIARKRGFSSSNFICTYCPGIEYSAAFDAGTSTETNTESLDLHAGRTVATFTGLQIGSGPHPMKTTIGDWFLLEITAGCLTPKGDDVDADDFAVCVACQKGDAVLV